MVTDAMRDPFVEYLLNPVNNKPFSQEYKEKFRPPVDCCRAGKCKNNGRPGAGNESRTGA
jgi:hypothetical protein